MIYAEVAGKNRKIKFIEYEVNENGCWVCTSHCLNCDGYPVIRSNGKTRRLNRVVLERSLGRKIREGLYALHKCNNKTCINPDHLYEGNDKENARDSINAGTNFYDKGTEVWSNKLTETQVLEIRKSNLSGPQLGKVYGVGKSCIYEIKKRRRWKHLKDQPS